MKKKLILIPFILIPFFGLQAQQIPIPLFTPEQGFIWNPAMTAIWQQWDVSANYRQQWWGFDGAPGTAMLAAQVPFPGYNMAMGAVLTHDKTGPLSFTGAQVSYKYQLNPNLLGYKDRLCLGIAGIAGQYAFNSADAKTSEQGDLLIDGTNRNAFDLNASFGFFYTTLGDKQRDESSFYVGAAASRAIPHDLAFSGGRAGINLEQRMHYNVVLGTRNHKADAFFEHTFWVNVVPSGIVNAAYHLQYEWPDYFWSGIYVNSGMTLGLDGGVVIGKNSWDNGYLRVGMNAQYNVGKVGRYQGFSTGAVVNWVKEL